MFALLYENNDLGRTMTDLLSHWAASLAPESPAVSEEHIVLRCINLNSIL